MTASIPLKITSIKGVTASDFSESIKFILEDKYPAGVPTSIKEFKSEMGNIVPDPNWKPVTDIGSLTTYIKKRNNKTSPGVDGIRYGMLKNSLSSMAINILI